MWLFFPPFPSSPTVEDSIEVYTKPSSPTVEDSIEVYTKPSSLQASMFDPVCTWRGKPSRWELWLKRWDKDAYIRRLFGQASRSAQRRSMRRFGAWLRDSFSPSPWGRHVNHTPPLATGSTPKTNVGSGRPSLPGFAVYDPVSSSLKMCQGSLWEDSTSSSLHLPRRGTLERGTVFALPKRVPLSGENGSSWSEFYPTPSATSWLVTERGKGAARQTKPGDTVSGDLGRELADASSNPDSSLGIGIPRREASIAQPSTRGQAVGYANLLRTQGQPAGSGQENHDSEPNSSASRARVLPTFPPGPQDWRGVVDAERWDLLPALTRDEERRFADASRRLEEAELEEGEGGAGRSSTGRGSEQLGNTNCEGLEGGREPWDRQQQALGPGQASPAVAEEATPESPLCGMAPGMAGSCRHSLLWQYRADGLRLLGNAAVPQQVALAFQTLIQQIQNA